jgi:hypothetical protein
MKPGVRPPFGVVWLLIGALNLSADGRLVWLGCVQVVLGVAIVEDGLFARHRYARHVSFVPGTATLVLLDAGRNRVKVALALRQHLGLNLWTAWRVAGHPGVPLVVGVHPVALAGAIWVLANAGARIRLDDPPPAEWVSPSPEVTSNGRPSP